MLKCKQCSQEIALGVALECKNCGSRYCTECGVNTLKICPICYYDLELVEN